MDTKQDIKKLTRHALGNGLKELRSILPKKKYAEDEVNGQTATPEKPL